jgi:hypothetical protein
MEGWSGFITDSKSALGALLDQPGTKRGTVASTLDYLRKVADREVLQVWRFDLISWADAPRPIDFRTVQVAPV